MKLMMAEQIEGKTLFYVNEDTLKARKDAESSSTGSHTSKGDDGSDGRPSTSGKKEKKEKGLLSWFGQMGQKVNNAIVKVANVEQSMRQREGYKRFHKGEQYHGGEVELSKQDQYQRQMSNAPGEEHSAQAYDLLFMPNTILEKTRRHIRHLDMDNIFPLLKYCTTAGRAFHFHSEGHDDGALSGSKIEQSAASETISADSNTLSEDELNDNAASKDGWVMERIPLEVRYVVSYSKSVAELFSISCNTFV